jgi:hypothetical protein
MCVDVLQIVIQWFSCVNTGPTGSLPNDRMCLYKMEITVWGRDAMTYRHYMLKLLKAPDHLAASSHEA